MSTEMKGAQIYCPIDRCIRFRKVEHAMCLFHWRKLPKILQAPYWSGMGNLEAANAFFAKKEVAHDPS